MTRRRSASILIAICYFFIIASGTAHCSDAMFMLVTLNPDAAMLSFDILSFDILLCIVCVSRACSSPPVWADGSPSPFGVAQPPQTGVRLPSCFHAPQPPSAASLMRRRAIRQPLSVRRSVCVTDACATGVDIPCVTMTRVESATTPGGKLRTVKNCPVVLSPGPPNHPNSFCVPCAARVSPTVSHRSKSPTFIKSSP